MRKPIVIKLAIAILIIGFGFGLRFMLQSAFTQAADPNLPSFTQLTDYVSSNRDTQLDDLTPAVSPYVLNPEQVTIQTELGLVYLDQSSLSFMIENENGYVFSSTVDYETSGLSPNWQRRVRSAIHIYAYNTNTPNNARTEEFVLSDNTSKSVRLIENGFESTITFGISRIQVLVRVRFLATGIKVEIPNDSIVESGNYKLGSLYVYPYFGAVKGDTIPGYMFVPDGVGALIRYPAASTTRQYTKEFYNPNFSFNMETNLNRLLSEGTQLYAPVFGFVQGINQNAVFAEIESGAENGILTVNFAGTLTPYNAIFTEFIYRRIYNQPIDKANNFIPIMQSDRNDSDIVINYQLLHNELANYVGMAKTYQQNLVARGALIKQTLDSSQSPLKIESIGLVRNEGVLFAENKVMTTLKALTSMVETLSAEIDHIVVAYQGFTKQGATWDGPNYGGLSNKLGSAKDLANLKSKVEDLYLVTDALKANSRSGDYQAFSDLAKKINEQSYRFEGYDHTLYLLKHSKVQSSFNATTQRLGRYDIDGLAITSLGNTLYADYGTGVSMAEAIEQFQNMVQAVDQKIALYDAYAYMWGAMDAYFDLPMYSSQYLSFTDTVPFIPIVLKGYMDLFGANANFYDYARDQLLRSIDFGVNISFIVTNASSKQLQETALNHIYTSRFTDLRPAIETYYGFVNGALQHVQNKAITARVVLATGVVKVVYEDDTTIYINYLNESRLVEGYTIQPKQYLVVRQGVILEHPQTGGEIR